MRRRTRRSLLATAAKVAGAVALVVVLVVVRPFVGADKPYSGSNLAPYTSGLVAPTYVTAAPGELKRLYFVEQAGRIRYLVGRGIAGTFLDIRSRVSSDGERGLLSVAFSPHYARDHRLYVDYTDRNGDTRVVEFRSRGGHALPDSARQPLFVRQPYPNHNGGQLQFGPDGLLYVDWKEVDFRPRAKIDVLANYGWRVFEGRARFAPGSPSAAGDLVPPISVYSHADGCSITGGYVYRGRTVPAGFGGTTSATASGVCGACASTAGG